MPCLEFWTSEFYQLVWEDMSPQKEHNVAAWIWKAEKKKKRTFKEKKVFIVLE